MNEIIRYYRDHDNNCNIIIMNIGRTYIKLMGKFSSAGIYKTPISFSIEKIGFFIPKNEKFDNSISREDAIQIFIPYNKFLAGQDCVKFAESCLIYLYKLDK